MNCGKNEGESHQLRGKAEEQVLVVQTEYVNKRLRCRAIVVSLCSILKAVSNEVGFTYGK